LSQVFGSGGSAGVNNLTSEIVLSTSWQRYTKTVAVPSVSGRTIGAGSFLRASFGLPLNSTFTIDIWGVQLEAGTVATPFKRNAPSIQAELAACQRYYYRRTATASQEMLITGYQPANTNIFVTWFHPQPMRATPSFSSFGGTWSPLNTPSDITLLAVGQVAISYYITVNASISNANQSSRIAAIGAFYEVSAAL
jgi:hypothetical protein